jgi:hypothetical protein
VAVYEDVEAWIFPFDDNVQTRGHRFESIVERSQTPDKLGNSNLINYRD